MTNKKFPRVTTTQKTILKSICDYFTDQSMRAPWRTDYIVLRVAEEATNEYHDTIFIPNFNDKDNFEYYSPFKCNAFASDAVKIVTGSYQYRLAKRLGIVYGQQMQPVFYYDSTINYAKSDADEKFFKGVNLIAHPVLMLFPPITPISNVSKGSIAIHPSAHALMKENFEKGHVSFNLYVIDLSFLV